MEQTLLCDMTLRNGNQGENISFTSDEILRTIFMDTYRRILDEFPWGERMSVVIVGRKRPRV